MKKARLFLIVALMSTPIPTLAEDWTMAEGKTYKSVVVISHDAKVVTINSSDGMATLPITLLNLDVQKRIQEDHTTATDWTVHGKEYHHVTVGTVDPDRVQIAYDGGTEFIMLADLPSDLQKKFNYDPQTAAKSSASRLTAQAQVQAEMAKEAKRRQADTEKAEEDAQLTDKVKKSALWISATITRKPSDRSAVVDYAYFVPDHGWIGNNAQILILGIPNDSVDGDIWHGNVYYAGVYKDSVNTMRQWTTTPEEAFRLVRASASIQTDQGAPQVPPQ